MARNTCSHDHDAWVEVRITWCARCAGWLYREEVVQPASDWVGSLERLSVKSLFLPVEDTTPDETLFRSMSAFARAQETANGDYDH